EHVGEAELREEVAHRFREAFDDFRFGPTMLGELLLDEPDLHDTLGLTAKTLPDQLGNQHRYEDLLKRIRDDHPVAWNTALDRVTRGGQWDNVFGSAAPVLYARHFGPGLLIADRMSGRVTAIHRDGSSTYPAPDQAVHLATEQNYTVVVHSPGHYDATTPTTRPTPHPAPTTRRETDESRPPTPERHTQAMDIDTDAGADAGDDRGHPGQDPNPDPTPALLSAPPAVGDGRTDGTTAVAFLGRIPKAFHAAASKDTVTVNSRSFALPGSEAEHARFAHQPLKGELVGSKVRFTNAVGERFEEPLDVPATQQLWPAGTTDTVFGLKVTVPGAPADHPVGEKFPGWYARLAGADGHRVVEWSRTTGARFTPEGDVTPYDEPTEVYKFRLATEKAGRPFTYPPAPTGPQTFRERVPELFYATAGATTVSVNGRHFNLPKGARQNLFANKALWGERTGDRATFTNTDGQWFDATLGLRTMSKRPVQPGSRHVFGVTMIVPGAPAGHPAGEPFPGWYPRLAGADGHRVVE
ncbi:hypothetical protein AB0K51_34800, partial [Kitasatospora sp. NPDC049285]|uniref:hypothetical protein n=1 Tax=Kitasatospora sp. NPDC049285 TaxID=3157096 RepID=UPI0034204A11